MSHSFYSHVNVYIFAFIGAYPMCEIQALVLRELLNFCTTRMVYYWFSSPSARGLRDLTLTAADTDPPLITHLTPYTLHLTPYTGT